MSFDLTKLDTRTKSEAGVAMKLYHPGTLSPILNEDKQEVTITLKGRNSKAHKDAFRMIQERVRERSRRGVTANDDDLRQDDADFLTALTVDWTFTELDGQRFPPTPENIRRLWFDDRFTWILEQATRFAANDGNFLGI